MPDAEVAGCPECRWHATPQHRIRPFWFGHMDGPCLVWPQRTHGSPAECATGTLPGVRPLQPWVTCRQALSHLSPADLGSPVRLRWRGQHSSQHGSVPDRPARVDGTTNLSDGNVLVHPDARGPRDRRAHRHPSKAARASIPDAPAGVVTANEWGDGNVLACGAHRPSRADAPARTLTKNRMGDGAILAIADMFAPSSDPEPPRGWSATARGQQTTSADRHPPSIAVTTKGDGRGAQGACVVAWPWDRPSTTVTTRDVVPPPGHHPETGSILSQPNAIKLSERAAAILQGFPERWIFVGKTKRSRWAQIGMAMPPALAEAVGRSIARARGWAMP